MEFAKNRASNIRPSDIDRLMSRVAKRKVGAPYLFEIRLEKIRRYVDARIRFDFPVTALIGTNGGGKSTVLGAAGLLYRSIKPRTFFAKSGEYDPSMQDWALSYEHWDIKGDSIKCKARYPKKKWERDQIDRPVVLLGVSRTLPATERKRLTGAISNSFKGVAESPLSVGAQKNVEKILGRDISSYITVDIDASGQEDKRFFASQSNRGGRYSEFHFGAGEASIIRIVQRLEDSERGTLVLIEEIENGLHPVATRLLVDYLIDVADRKALQIIFTTHSDSAIAGLPDDAIWACVDGKLSQGRLQVSALRALTGEVKIGAALFVEDEFSEMMLESAIRAYRARHKRFSLEGVGIYHVGGAQRVIDIVKHHNLDPSIRSGCDVAAPSPCGSTTELRFPAVAVLDGDCRNEEQFRNLDNTFFLPGRVPEVHVYEAIDDRFESVSKVLMKKLDVVGVSESEFVESVRRVHSLCRDMHVLFSAIGDQFDFLSEYDVRKAFLQVWCAHCPEEVDELVGPLVRYFPGYVSSDDPVSC